MEKIVISVEEMAKILLDSIGFSQVVCDSFCLICKEMHDGCPVEETEDCPHEDIVEYRYFVRRHFKKFIVRE